MDQTAIAAGLGAATFTVTREAAGSITQQAVEYALTKRTAVVIAIPYDLAALEAEISMPRLVLATYWTSAMMQTAAINRSDTGSVCSRIISPRQKRTAWTVRKQEHARTAALKK